MGTEAKKFVKEIVPVPPEPNDKFKGKSIPDLHVVDEGIRPVVMEKIKKLSPINKSGVLSAVAASQITDGAAAVMIVNERGLKKLGIKPRAKITAMAVAG